MDYYTDYPLEGTPTQEGQYQPSPEYAQGNDIVMQMLLSYEDVPVDDTQWKLEVFVKRSVSANLIDVYATLNQGLFSESRRGLYTFIIPAATTSSLEPGLYFLTVRGTQKIGTGKMKDVAVDLLSSSFNIVLTASSPYPTIA